MQYPSINSVAGMSRLPSFTPDPLTPLPGSASRNRDAILQALTPYIESASVGRILEISSGSGEHVIAMAERWPDIEFWPSERNEEQLRFLGEGIAQLNGGSVLGNLKKPVQLDVTSEDDWTSTGEKLRKQPTSTFTGVVICNLLHCSPVRTQDDIFSHLGSAGTGSQALVGTGGWVAVYGAFLKDDGRFASEGDEKFNQRFKGLHPDFGLRRIPDVEQVAAKYGFLLEIRIPMPAGNWMLVFRRQGGEAEL